MPSAPAVCTETGMRYDRMRCGMEVLLPKDMCTGECVYPVTEQDMKDEVVCFVCVYVVESK